MRRFRGLIAGLAVLVLLGAFAAPTAQAASNPSRSVGLAGIRASHIDTWNGDTWYERRNVGPSSTIYVRVKLTFTSSSEGFVNVYAQNTGTLPRTVRLRLIATAFDPGKTWRDRTYVLPSNGGFVLYLPNLPCLSHSYHAGIRVNVDGQPYQDVNIWYPASRGSVEHISNGNTC